MADGRPDRRLGDARSHHALWLLLIMVGALASTLLAVSTRVAGGQSAAAPTEPLVYGAQAGQSLSLSLGVTHVAHSADPYENPEAVRSAKALLGAQPVYQNQAIMGFGVGNPEVAPGVYDWSGLDRRLTTIRDTGGVPVITLIGAPDWMKGGPVGETDYGTVPYAPYAQHYADFANLAVMVARRYPDVRHFQVWNELKGFWDNRYQRWKHVEYTEMYNAVYDALKRHDRTLKIGGPYVTIESYATSSPPPGSLTGPWGTVDRRSLDVLTYWLAHKHGADFVSLDARATTSSGGQQADEFTSAGKFAAVNAWVRERTTLPIWWSEFYAQPPGTSWSPEHQNAALSATLAEMASSGASVALLWEPEGHATTPTRRGHLWTYAAEPGGGQPTPLYDSFQSFTTHFRPAVTDGQTTDDTSVVINPTEGPLAYDGGTLAPYEVRFVQGAAQPVAAPPAATGGSGGGAPAAGGASTRRIATAAGGNGRGIAMHVAQAPDAVAVGNNTVYATDTVNNVVRATYLTGIPTRRLETVFAGAGAPGFSGDGGPAASARLNDPQAVAVGGDGTVYIADAGNMRVRKVTSDGTISTVAGSGVFGSTGDGGPATRARLGGPTALALDGSGNLYIADSVHNVVRRVDPAGTITTVAGNRTQGYSGDGGLATAAQLHHPNGVAVDGDGNLLIADTGNSALRSVSPSGVITTVAGNGTPGFSGDDGPAAAAQLDHPMGLAISPAGTVAIADDGNNRVRTISPGGVIITLAGTGVHGMGGDGGPAFAAKLDDPKGVAYDPDGNLYIADVGNRRVRAVSSTGTISSPVGGGLFRFSGDGALATAAELNRPAGVAVDARGNLYISDSHNHRVRQVSPSGVITTVAGTGAFGFSGDGGPGKAAQLNRPEGLAVDAAGNLYIADFYNNRIRKLTPDGTISTIAGYGVYGFAGDGGGATRAWLAGPTAVAVDRSGTLYIADSGNNRVRKVTPQWGQITTIAGDGTFGFSGDGGPGNAAALSTPRGLAAGADGQVYIADSINNRVRMVSATGVITTVAGTGIAGFSGERAPALTSQLAYPQDVAVASDGSLYVADAGNNRVRVIDPSGAITTAAGYGAHGFDGDGGPANWARLAYPIAIATGPDGSLHISDVGNHRVRTVR